MRIISSKKTRCFLIISISIIFLVPVFAMTANLPKTIPQQPKQNPSSGGGFIPLPSIEPGTVASRALIVSPMVTSTSNPPSLNDFWNGNAYFERSKYTTSNGGNDDFQELAPLVNPLGNNPNEVWVYFRHNDANGHGQINLSHSDDGGATYSPLNGGNPVLCLGNGAPPACNNTDSCAWDANNVIMPSVVNVGGKFFMVYEGDSPYSCFTNSNWTFGDIGLATSTDGVTWMKYNSNGRFLNHNTSSSSFECNNIGGPSVTYLNGQFYVFFHGDCGGPTDAATYSTCIASSIFQAPSPLVPLAPFYCARGAVGCVALNNPHCALGFRFDNLRNKVGMVHASGTDLTQLQSPLQNSVNGASPIMDIGVGIYSWDARVDGRPNVIYEGGYYYLFFEGADYALCQTYPIGNWLSEGNWGWGVGRTSDINNGPWDKYANNPIQQLFQNQGSGCGVQQPYVFQLNGVTWVYYWPALGNKGLSDVLLWGTDPYLHYYPAINGGRGQCEVYHKLGFVDSDGWAQTTGVNNDYLCYGPYQSFSNPNDYSSSLWTTWTPGAGAIPAGNYAVTFRNMIDSLNCGGDFPPGVCAPIATLDVTYNSGNVRAAMIVPSRNDYQFPFGYQNFEAQFAATTTAAPYEWRTFFDSHAYLRAHDVTLRQLDGNYDLTTPTASMNPLPGNSGNLAVSWSGSDAETGIWSFDVQYQINSLGWVPWQMGTTSTSATFSGAQCFNTYSFQVRARDFAGNTGPYSSTSVYIACDFTIAPSTQTITAQPSQTGTATLSLSSINGFTGSVSLSVSPPPTGLSCSAISPSSITLPSSPATATLSCSASLVGSYQVTVTANSGALSHTATVTFLVIGSLTVTSNTASAPATIAIQTSNSQANVVVSLSTSFGTLSASSCTTGSTGSCTVTISSNAPGSATVTATAAYYNSGSTTLTIPAITLSAIPGSLPADGSTTSTITAQLTNNAQGITISFTTTGGTLSATSCITNSTGSCTITIKSSTPGFFTVTTTATNYVTGLVTITVFDFAMTTSPLALDGTNSAFCGSTTNFCTTSLTTTRPNDIVIAYTFEALDQQTTCNFGIVDSANLAWTMRGFVSGRNDGTTRGNRDEVAEFWARSPGLLSSDAITEIIGGCGNNNNGLQVMAVSGANFNNPFDPTQPGLGSSSGSAPAVSISTFYPNDMIIGTAQATAQSGIYLAQGPGFSLISTTGGFCGSLQPGGSVASEYTLTSFKQPNVAVSFGDCPPFGWWEEIADAIVAAPSNPVNAGSSSGASIILTSINGFSGTVSLSDTVPSGLTCSAISPSSIGVSTFAPAIATLSCSSTTAGTYSVTVTGVSGTLTHSVTITFIFVDFSINAVPNAITVFAGSSASATINVNSLNGFTGTVSITTSPASQNCSVNPASVNLGPNTSVTLSCPEPAGGQYTVTVTGTSGSLSHSVPVTIYVADFTITVSPTSTTVLDQSSTTVSLTITTNAQWGGWQIYLFGTGPSGTSFSFSQYPLLGPSQTATVTATISASGSATPGNYVVQITGQTGGLTHSVNINLAIQDISVSVSPATISVQDGRAGSLTVSVTSVNGFAGTVSLSTSTLPSCVTASYNPTSLSLTAGSTLQSTLTLTVGASCTASNVSISAQATAGTDTRSAPLTLAITDYSISVSPPTIGVWFKNTAQVTVTGTSLNGYTGTVSLSVTNLPGCLFPIDFAFSPTSITIPSSGSGTSTLSIVPGSCGTAIETVTIQGSDGFISRTTPITVGYGTFVLSASPNPTNGYPTSTTSTTITVSQVVGGPTDTVSLSATSNLPASCGTPTLNPTGIPIPSGGTSTLTVNVGASCPTGTYQITVSGATKKLFQTTTFNLAIGDFSLCCANSYSLPAQGAILYTGVSLTSVNGFTGTLTLSVSPTTVGDSTISLSPTSITVIPGKYTAATLQITSGTIAGTWSFTVTGTVGGLVHSIKYNITITPCCSGGGGSVAAGTMITLADGSQIPVQNLKVGMQLLSYDMTTHQYVTTTITRFTEVTTFNQMEIHTATGKPLIVDQNPAQKVYVKLPDGTVTLMSVTDLKIGYDLFDALSLTWTPITEINFQNGGTHTMYDIYTTTPGNYIANGYLDPVKT